MVNWLNDIKLKKYKLFTSNRRARACINSTIDTFCFKVKPENLFHRYYAIIIIKKYERCSFFVLTPPLFVYV